MFLLLFRLQAVAATRWFAARDLNEDTQNRLTEEGCFRGSYGTGLSLLSCETEGSLFLGELPDEAFLCVMELKNSSLLSEARDVMVAHDVHHTLLYLDHSEVVFKHSDPAKLGELPPLCCTEHFPANNARYVPTFDIIPQPPIPTHLRAVKRALGEAAMDPVDAIAELVNEFSRENVYQNVVDLSSMEGDSSVINRNSYATRPALSGYGGCQPGWRCSGNGDSDENPDTSVNAWLQDRLNDYFQDFQMEWFIQSEKFREDMCPNIKLRIPSEMGDSDGMIILGAHLDSRNTNSGSQASGSAPGADDNGSGSAVLLEIARVLAEEQYQFENTIELQWYCGEEQGLVGSAALASEYRDQGVPVIGMFNNDMIGYTDPNHGVTLSFMTGAATSWLSNTCKAFSELYVPDMATADAGVCCSDQQSWFLRGFPAAGIFETPTSSVTYPEYHRSGDTYDNGLLNYDQIFQFGQANLACSLEYAVPLDGPQDQLARQSRKAKAKARKAARAAAQAPVLEA